MINRAWNQSASFRLTQWLNNTHQIRSYYHCCCIYETVNFSHSVLKLGHQFNTLLKVCSDRDDTIPLTLTTTNLPKSSKGHFFGKIQHCWKLVLSPLQMGQNYYLARSTGLKCWIWKINENAWCILKIRTWFQTCTGGFWRIQEGS